MSTVVPVILSGGVGSRLWPTSRSAYPKQLLPLVSERGMLQETVARVADNKVFSAPMIISNDEHRFIIAAQLQEMGMSASHHVLEPQGRNTAPAAAVAALLCAPDDIILILPADHHIEDQVGFQNAVANAQKLCEDDKIVTFGIVPKGPETGYGYIQQGNELPETGAYEVACFVEKPNKKTAEDYLTEGNYCWNSGIFMFKAQSIINEMQSFCPEILNTCRASIAAAHVDIDFLRLDAEIFSSCPSDSIDYAVMEKTENAVTIPIDIGWNDIGSWDSLWEIGSKDDEGNVIVGDVISVDSKNNYVRSENSLIATLGLEDMVIVETGDVVLVAKRDCVQEVKKLVALVVADDRSEHKLHKRVYRPWGYYESITEGYRHQVKHLYVNPGASLSMQLHHQRAEHWVVVRGTARVTVGDTVSDLNENESTYIPVETKHRLENPFTEPVSIIEVQSGAYLGEDDIVRFDDVYGRAPKTNAAE